MHAAQVVSITDLKRNFSSILSCSEGEPIAVLNHNKPEAYLVPAEYYEKLIERLEDLEDALLVAERSDIQGIPVKLGDL
jgi:antitoxin StbD